MDSALIPNGVKRCSIGQFALWIAVVGAVLLWGVWALLLSISRVSTRPT